MLSNRYRFGPYERPSYEPPPGSRVGPVKLPIPGPGDLFNAAEAIRDGVGDALALVPRLTTVVDDVEALLARVSAVVTRIETVVDRADAAIVAVEKTDRAAASVVSTVSITGVRAAELLDLYEAPLTTMAPTMQTLAETTSPEEVAALVSLLDRVPRLAVHLDEDILPILGTLDRVGPDLHQLLEVAQDVQQAVSGLPGMGWIRKRAEKEDEQATEEQTELEDKRGGTI